MEGSAVAAYDPSRVRQASGRPDQTAGKQTRLEEATAIASHGADRITEIVHDARAMIDSRLGPQPPTAVGTNGNKEPSMAGSANELHQQLRRLHGAIDQLQSELQRLREL